MGTNELKLPVKLFVGWISDSWAGAIADIVNSATSCGHEIVIHDIGQFVYPPTSRKIAEIEGVFRHRSRVRIYTVNRGSLLAGMTPRESGWQRSSISSELLTKYLGQTPKWFRWIFAAERFVINKMSGDLFSQLLKLDMPCDAIWIIPNGRFAHQRAVREAAEALGREVYFYELSNIPGKYFFRAYPPHDRESLQAHFRSSRGLLGEGQIKRAKEFFVERSSPESEVNPFNNAFKSSSENASVLRQKIVSFFPSSRDEFEALGSQWSLLGWEDQFEGFEAVAHALRSLDYKFIIRVHPNLLNKSTVDMFGERKKILKFAKSTGAEVVPAGSARSSYQIIDESEVVVIARSWVGLEALTRGKRVISVADSYFDCLEEICLVTPKSVEAQIIDFATTYQATALSAIEFVAFEDFCDKSKELVPLLEQIPMTNKIAWGSLVPKLIYYCSIAFLNFFSLPSRMSARFLLNSGL